jgi:hypothetical protein
MKIYLRNKGIKNQSVNACVKADAGFFGVCSLDILCAVSEVS